MSTALIPIGNHNIVFKGRNYKEVALEIKQKLDEIVFVNAEYYRLLALQCNSNNPGALRSINTQKEWIIREEEEEYYSFAKDKYLEFDGPYGFNLTFDEAKITFFEPSVASYWLGTRKCDYHPWRNEWRKFMCQVVTHFGGNKVIYLADNAHPLEEYVYIYEGSFNEIETLIKEKFGEPKGLFEYEIEDIDYDMYFVDDFKTINWEQNVEFDSYLPESDGTSEKDFDLK